MIMAAQGEQPQEFKSLPAAESCRLIDFDNVDILILESFPPQYVLVVAGTKPYLNMTVQLIPRVYVRQPEYWGIEVVGCLPGLGLPALAPYTVSISLNGITGTKGIEVIGATRSEKREIPPEQPPDQHTLLRRWLHSFEEDTVDIRVYRPSDFHFPPARGRDGFEFKKSGEFIQIDIGPADGIQETRGRWEARGGGKINVTFDDPELESYTLDIVSCVDDILWIRK
jgi:hypothetical protein